MRTPTPEHEQLNLFGDGEQWGVNMKRLRARVEDLAASGEWSRATRRVYEHDWRAFAAWCGAAGRQALPATADTVRLYLAHEIEAGLKLATVKKRLAALCAMHRAAGERPPRDEATRRMLAAAARRRAGEEAPVRKRALGVEELAAMVRACRGRAGVAVRDRALLLLGFASGLRRSELAALDVLDVRVRPKGYELRVRRSKVDQAGAGRTVAVFRGRRRALCPVAALGRWLEVRGRWPGPLWTRGGEDGRTTTREGLSAAGIAERVQLAARRAGLVASEYGGHSLRAGMITAATEAGAPVALVMQRSGHKSLQTVLGYVRSASAWSADPLAGVL
jgi:site-specific recombinase XerD